MVKNSRLIDFDSEIGQLAYLDNNFFHDILKA